MVAYLERTQSIMVIQWSPTTRNTQYEYTVEYRIRISTLKALSKVTWEDGYQGSFLVQETLKGGTLKISFAEPELKELELFCGARVVIFGSSSTAPEPNM